jgi:hypothetical protein
MESSRSCPRNVIFKSWNRLRSRVHPTPSRESIPQRKLFSQGIDSVESKPGILKDYKIWALPSLPADPWIFHLKTT